MKLILRSVSFFGLAAIAYLAIPFFSNRSDNIGKVGIFAIPVAQADVPVEGVESCGESCECCGCECCGCEGC